MKIISITGGVGSGKSEVLKILQEEFDAEIILADQVAHELMEPGTEGYRSAVGLLGSYVLREDGSINRQKMAAMLFKEKSLVEQMNALIHPLAWEEIKRRILSSIKSLVVVEAALYDEEHNAMFDEIWYVHTSVDERVRRLMDNRGYTREKCLEIMGNQASETEFRSFADKIINNNGTVEQLRSQLYELLKEE